MGDGSAVSIVAPTAKEGGDGSHARVEPEVVIVAASAPPPHAGPPFAALSQRGLSHTSHASSMRHPSAVWGFTHEQQHQELIQSFASHAMYKDSFRSLGTPELDAKLPLTQSHSATWVDTSFHNITGAAVGSGGLRL